MNLSSSLGAGWAGSPAVLSQDGERVLCRGWRDEGDSDRTAVLAVLSASDHPTPQFVDRLAHEYGLKDELDGRVGGTAARACARTRAGPYCSLRTPGASRSPSSSADRWRWEGSCASPPVYRPRFASYTNVG